MAEQKTKAAARRIPMALSLAVLRFDGEGGGTREEFLYPATYEAGEATCRLLYRERPDAADAAAGADTAISFESGTPCVVKLQKTGAIATEMCFAAGRSFTAEYRLAGLGSFPAVGEARRVSNTLTAAGGEILLDYTLTLGGARTRTVMTLTATPTGEATAAPAGAAEKETASTGESEVSPCK